MRHLLGHDHVASAKPAVVLVADGRLVLADLHPALLALVALATARPRCALDAGRRPASPTSVGPDLDALAGDPWPMWWAEVMLTWLFFLIQ